jgi:hypothetical protein
MKTTHSFGIDFITRKCRDNPSLSIIYARINVDGLRREISLKEHIDNSEWMAEKEMVRGRTMEAKGLNEEIDNVRFKIKSKYRMLKDSEALITADSVKEAYLGIHTLQKGHKLLELLNYYQRIWKDKLKNGGFKNYKTTAIYIERFLKSKFPSGDIYLSQLSIELATDFEHFVRNHPIKPGDPCLGNGLSKHIQRFKRIVNWARTDEWFSTWRDTYQSIAQDYLFPHPDYQLIFPDNHDVDRFYSRLNRNFENWKLGIAMYMTMRGIPEFTYGTEVLMTNEKPGSDGQRRGDFYGGWPGDKKNAITGEGLTDKEKEAQKYFSKLLNWRKTNKAIQSGKLMHYAPQKNDVYVYFRYDEKQKVMILLNKNKENVHLDMKRYSEMIPARFKARDIITDREFEVNNTFEVSAKTAMIMEIN